MKKLVMLLVALVVTLPIAYAAVDSIYEYLQRVDNNHKIVLGAKAKGGDSFAAIDVAIGIQKHNLNQPDLESVIETEVQSEESKILIGHPCDNSLVPLSCEAWPYNEGEAVIRVVGNDLIIAGSSLEDTRRAAKIIGNYKAYDVLKETLSLIVTGEKFEKIDVVKEKSPDELICGDNICDPGERLCYIDCAKISCFDACKEEGFDKSSCRDKRSNPNVPSCLAEEYNKGLGYCATGKVCCCEKILIEEQKNVESETNEAVKKMSLLQRIVLFVKKLFGLDE